MWFLVNTDSNIVEDAHGVGRVVGILGCGAGIATSMFKFIFYDAYTSLKFS